MQRTARQWRGGLVAALMGLMYAGGACAQTAGNWPTPPAAALQPDFAGQRLSFDIRQTAHRALALGDTQGLPFAIVDKKNALLAVFDAAGRLVGQTPVLLGSAVGDTYFPELNKRDLNQLLAHERTTPAGRFVAEPGRNLQGEAVVWVDYGSAFAIHRLRPSPARERRAERLASATPDDNRISLGCVVTPVAFYEQVVAPLLGQSRAVVYVLPDSAFSGDLFETF